MNLISVIVPIYNVECYLERTLKTIINQTYENIEIILINDGSTDNSFTICKLYASRDSRIKIVNKKNGGLSSARNAGLEIAHGDYYIFVDSDDSIENNFIEVLLELILSNNCLISICDVWFINENTTKKMLDLSTNMIVNGAENVMSNLIPKKGGISNYLCNKMFHKSLFDNLRFDSNKKFEDVYIMYKILLKVRKIVCTSQTHYNYYLRTSSITGMYKANFKEMDLIEANKQKYEGIKLAYPKLSTLAFHQYASAIIYYINNSFTQNTFDSKIGNQLLIEINKISFREKYWNLSFFNFLKLFILKNFTNTYKFIYTKSRGKGGKDNG